ncbi:TonB-dependent receptor plug domain-containing protein [Billgrantia desiderata]|uniref:TonB-dependent receptor plug domain-containing protein n=1 Tax=Billgrantia desiderata TaxID=52021 RepID=UPI001F3AA040|nr:TonB-dependent receptor [Halomonas desiderata]MCE8011497.1 TonB-dependent receptor [Halomonas desiderata]
MGRQRYAWLGGSLVCLLAWSPAWAETAETGQPRVGSLSPLVVTATRSEIRREEAPSGYSEVTREDIERQPATTLAELLRDVPGLAIDNEQDGRSQIRVRGFNPGQTLILVNGRRLNNTDELVGHSDFRMTQIPTAAIDRIEVVRGPTSSLYGADALGGVINVIVRPPEDTWAGRVQSRLGSVHPRSGGSERNLAVHAAGPLSERVGAMLSLDYLDRDGVLNPDQPGIDEIEGREALSGMGSLFFRPGEGHEVELFFHGSDDERRARRGDADTRELDIRRYSTGARYQFDAPTWTARVDAYRSRSDSEALHLDRRDQHTDDIVDASATYYWGAGQELTVGADHRREHFSRDREGEREHDDTVNHRGVLVQNRGHFLDDRLVLTLGTRYDDHTRYTGEVSPRAGAVYALTPSTRLKADYGRGFSAPDLRRSAADYDFTFATRPLRIIGNPDLEPERSDSYSLALEHEDERHRAAITLFRNDIKDLIDLRCIEFCDPGSRPPGEDELRTYINVDRARTQGVELELGRQFDDGSLLRANYTYLDARNRDTGETLEWRPRQRFNLLAETPVWQGAAAHLRGEYIGSQRRGEVRTRDYTLLHMGLRQSLGHGLSLAAGIDNLTDQRLAEVDDAFINEIRGRFYHASLNWEF